MKQGETTMISISRKSAYADRIRHYKIFVNNNFYCKISQHETVEIDVPQGNYSIFAKIDWCKSNVVHIENDNTIKELEVAPSLGNITGFKSIFLNLLCITIWKNKYLWIK